MTIDEYAADNPPIDGRIALPHNRWDPAGQRWLVPELTDFGTTIYTYCEENTDAIVEDLVGTLPLRHLRFEMAAAIAKYPEGK